MATNAPRQTGVVAISTPAKVATVYDVTSAINTALDSGILDVSAWDGLSFIVVTGGAVPAVQIISVDDAGANGPTIATVTVNNAYMSIGPGVNQAANKGEAQLLPRRIRVTQIAIAAQTARIRIEGRRLG